MSEWAELHDIKPATLWARLRKYNMDFETAITR